MPWEAKISAWARSHRFHPHGARTWSQGLTLCRLDTSSRREKRMAEDATGADCNPQKS